MPSGGETYTVIDMASENRHNVGEGKNLLCEVWSGFAVCDRSIRGEEAVRFENTLHDCAEVRMENGEALPGDKRVVGDEKVEKVVRAENPKKKGCKKPPKPPRPPRPPRPLSLDFADQKLVREISELAMLKKAKAGRMKILKKIKNGKSASSSAGNTFALVISLIFCILIFWQGIFPKGSTNSAFLGSPQPSIGNTTSKSSSISIHFYSNASINIGSSRASPKYESSLKFLLASHCCLSRCMKRIPLQ